MEYVLQDFKNECKIENSIITKTAKANKFQISMDYLSRNMDIEREKMCLNGFCEKYGINHISNIWDPDFDIIKVISIRPLLECRFYFTFSKKNDFSFFS